MTPTGNQLCDGVQRRFSDYLDGTISGREMQTIGDHLESCASCSQEFASWRGMQSMLTAVGSAKAPVDLGLKLRLAISHESALRQGRSLHQLGMRWDNFLRPALVQVSAGLAGAVALIGGIIMLVGLAAPQAVQANDEPLGAVTAAHYLYCEAGQQPVVTEQDMTIVIEADINSAGRVYDYTIVSGPTDEATQAQLRDQLLVQVYEPARVFGEPVRGRVLITFAGVSVRG